MPHYSFYGIEEGNYKKKVGVLFIIRSKPKEMVRDQGEIYLGGVCKDGTRLTDGLGGKARYSPSYTSLVYYTIYIYDNHQAYSPFI